MGVFKKVFGLILGVFFCGNIFSQSFKLQKSIISQEEVGLIKITWNNPVTFQQSGKTIKTLSFDGVFYISEKDYLPVIQLKEVCPQGNKVKPIIQIIATQSLSAAEEACVNKNYLTNNFEVVESFAGISQKVTYMYCKVSPLRLNKTTGQIEKLIYRLQWQQTNEAAIQRNGNTNNKTQNFATTSVLASGSWYKIGTAKNAIYKIDKTLLQHIVGSGVDISSIDPRNIKIYGNGGEMLSEANSAFHYDDLTENAIFVKDTGTVGTFDNGDYILFYGQSAHKWHYVPGANPVTRYSLNRNYYSDSVFYFLTIDNSSFGKRIPAQANESATITNVVTTFDDFFNHENDLVNPVISGREMYGESFENNPSYSFNFPFAYLQKDTVWLKVNLLGRSTSGPGSFTISRPGGSYQVTFPSSGSGTDVDIGAPITETGGNYFIDNLANNTNSNSTLPLTITLNNSSQSGWLNYIYANVRRALILPSGQMGFRDYRCIGANNVSQFNIQSSSSSLRVWNVSNQFAVTEQQPVLSTIGTYSFSVRTDSLQQFITFDGTSYETPGVIGLIANQNLHSLQNIEYVIVAPKIFFDAAQKVANLHADPKNENLSYVIVTPDEIYNEFSSGVQDITAIRQLMRLLYQNSTVMPRYLLLYGTGSYKLKNRYDANNTDVIPVFETYNSWSYIHSKTGDDFYGFLDDNEGVIDIDGNTGSNLLDIGVGRIVAKNVSEADAVANKIVKYYNRVEPTSSCCDQATLNAPDWRNWISLIADDANVGTSGEYGFLTQQEGNASTIQAIDARYNVDKIYEDYYQVEAVPGGRRYPDVNTAINNKVAQGCLIMGYSGHGGELNLSHEDIIDINQINSWNNINNMPLFFTATCEFSRYDDPAQESAGEDILLNPNGAGIGLFTTTRLAYISDGVALGPAFYKSALNFLPNGKRPTLGDIIRLTKQSQTNYLHFALLGDPALTLSYPKQNTSNLTVNSHVYAPPVNDTLSALGKYTITGFISDLSGNKINNFNGTIYITVFDKPSLEKTLNNSQNIPASDYIIPFYQQKSVLYKGKSVVTNGDFTYTFIVPKDIMYNLGNGKISYYAQSDTSDAAGYNVYMVVGGGNNAVTDHQGPGINLYMNDNHFVQGGTTNQNPFIYALLSDSSGINTTGNGLGHDITAILDANTPNEVVLNDYYQADLNKYQSGKILYQLKNLPTGNHTLNLKVWDVMDNSSVTSTDFVVATNAQMALTHVLNYPNPFTTSTNFFIEHNQACDFLNIEVQIYTITGKVVKTILQTVQNQGFRTEGIHWDGRDEFGDKLARGVYIYKVIVKNSEGSKADKIEKLVILN